MAGVSFFLFLSSGASNDNVKIVPYDTPIRSVLQCSAWSRLSKTLKMYLGIQFRRNLQYVFGNKSGTRIERIFTEITKRTNKKQSVSFSFCLDKTYHPLWLMKLHHRRHLAQCLSLRNLLYVWLFLEHSRADSIERCCFHFLWGSGAAGEPWPWPDSTSAAPVPSDL